MKKIRICCLLLALLLTLSACGAQNSVNEEKQPVQQETEQLPSDSLKEQTLLEETAAWILSAVPEPVVGSTFGEWAVLGLARSGAAVPEGYFDAYYKNLEAYTQNCQGVLDSRKYTEFSRVTLALTAVGKDPADVAGYDLVAPLANFDQTVFQGPNGAAYAILALSSGDHTLPACPEGAVQGSVESYAAHLLEKESEGGGWSLSGGAAEVDMTAMVLQALAHCRNVDGVEQAIERGLEVLAQSLNSGAEVSCEGMAQTIVALTELGIALEDERFAATGKNVVDQLLTFRTADGGFAHLLGEEVNQMATEQAFYALAAAHRAEQGMTSLYDMSDVG